MPFVISLINTWRCIEGEVFLKQGICYKCPINYYSTDTPVNPIEESTCYEC